MISSTILISSLSSSFLNDIIQVSQSAFVCGVCAFITSLFQGGNNFFHLANSYIVKQTGMMPRRYLHHEPIWNTADKPSQYHQRVSLETLPAVHQLFNRLYASITHGGCWRIVCARKAVHLKMNGLMTRCSSHWYRVMKEHNKRIRLHICRIGMSVLFVNTVFVFSVGYGKF